MTEQKIRCAWGESDPLYIPYHDQEWGLPEHDDRKLFEMLILEGAQAGLSWITILKKRAAYLEAFDNFDAQKIALYGEDKMAELLNNAGIIRNKLKIRSAISNAQIFLDIQKDFGSFESYIWAFVGSQPIINQWQSLSEIPAVTSESQAMSKDLKKRGFRFVGPTICYAFMQATGMVNDHIIICFRYKEVMES